MNSNTEADVIQTNWNWLTLLSKKGDGFYDLNKLSQPLGLDQYPPEALATTTVNGKINAIPISSNVMLFFYNAATWTKAMASFGKGVNYEMKPWINGEWGGVYNWNVLYTAESQNLKNPSDLVMGPYPMHKDAKDAGQFRKTALMYSISRNTRHPQEAAQLLHFLMSESEGVLPVGLERGAPLSRDGEKILRDAGILKDEDPVIAGLIQSTSMPNKSTASPYLEDPQFGALFTASRESIDHGKASIDEAATTFEEQANRILRRIMR